MGPPGSGKGTQADFIAQEIGAVHFDTGRYLEELMKNDDPSVPDEEKRKWREGELNSPDLVLRMVKKKVGEIQKSGESIVFSGSPRTAYEAFGDENNIGLIEYMKTSFGEENVMVFRINVPEEVSMDRNSNRTVCSKCKKVFMKGAAPEKCDNCGGELYKRALDDPEVIKVRLATYIERTKPIFDGLEKSGVKIIEIDGKPLPPEVFKSIKQYLA